MTYNTKHFATAVNCIDGRVQLPVIEYLKSNYDVDYVDMITETGPIKIITENVDSSKIERIKRLIDLSIVKHGSKHVAVVGHHDCAGNSVEKETQIEQIEASIHILKQVYEEVEFIGIWVDETFQPHKVYPLKTSVMGL
ncbi:MAG: hypothetical protein ISR65_09010 [Bacteriovoracaceae bacterium]|nr:hypothetical protein [Bacteriovoracaceae bacterium]